MFRIFLSCLAVGAIGLIIGQAIAGGNNHQASDNQTNPNNGGVVIIETISASSAVQPVNDNDMEPLPNNPGVEVAPVENNGSSVVPVMVEEEGMIIQQNND